MTPDNCPRRGNRQRPFGWVKIRASSGRDEIVSVDVNHFDARPLRARGVRVTAFHGLIEEDRAFPGIVVELRLPHEWENPGWVDSVDQPFSHYLNVVTKHLE